MRDTLDSEPEQNYTTFASISIAIVTFCCYLIGLFLQLRIIRVSKKEKDLTWKIDISNSVCLLTYYGFSIFIHFITSIVPDLHTWTGPNFCYISKIFLHYGLLYTISHSAVVSMLKYYVIVRPDAPTFNEKESLKSKFFWINLLHPMIHVSINLILTPDFYVEYGGFASINKCLGVSKPAKTRWIQFCSFIKPQEAYSLDNFLYVVKRIICLGQSISVYIIAFNLFDIFFYVAIFRHMKRKILPKNNNISKRTLSQSSNDINRKKIKVNSQITAMISFLEFSITLFYVVILGVVIKKTTFGTLITAMLLYLIVLPYSFLMNTSNNKNRIVEVGWKTVFKNIIRGSLRTTDSQESSINSPKSKIHKIKVNETSGSKKTFETSTDNEHVSDPLSCWATKSLKNNFDTTEPTTSNGSFLRSKSLESTSDQSDKSEILLTVSNLGEKKNIVSLMADNLDDESVYLIYFKHFLDFHMHRKQEYSASFNVSIDDLLNDNELSISVGFGHNKSKRKCSAKNVTSPINIARDCKTLEQMDTYKENELMTILKCSKKARYDLRKDLLTKLQECYEMKESLAKSSTFNCLVEELISLEEGFINDC